MPGLVWVAAGALVVGLVGLVLLAVHRPVSVPADRLSVGAVAVSPVRWAGGTDETVALAERVLARFDPATRLPVRLELAGITTSAADLLVTGVVGSFLGLVVGGFLGGFVAALGLAACVPTGIWALISVRSGRRQRAFAEQLDDGLQLMASGLRAGHSLLRAVDAVSRDTPAPMSEEFARVVNEVRVGRDITDALTEVADRYRNDDFRWVVQAISVHREVGGNLAEVLDRVGETLRDRAQLFRQARSLSAEGRVSGVVLLIMPFAVVLLISLTSPDYLYPLFNTGVGWVMVAIAVTLMTVGALWLRSIVKVRF